MANANLQLETIEGDWPKETCPHCGRDMEFDFHGESEILEECFEDTERTCAVLMHGQCPHCFNELYRVEFTVIPKGLEGYWFDSDRDEKGETETRYLLSDGTRKWRLIHYENASNIRMYKDGEPETRISAEWLDWYTFPGLKGWPFEDRAPEEMVCEALKELRPLIAKLQWE